jgi:hypothetical protein
MPPKDRLRLNDLDRTDQVRLKPDHPYQQRPVTAAQSKARRCLPQSDVELMTEKQVLSSSLRRDFNMSAMNITSECRIASITPDDAMVIPHDANLRRMEFSERTGDYSRFQINTLPSSPPENMCFPSRAKAISQTRP